MYPRGEGTRPVGPRERMLRIYCMRQLFNLPDVAMRTVVPSFGKSNGAGSMFERSGAAPRALRFRFAAR